MSRADSALFAAGHGFYQFAISRSSFDRSLYYNLLLQPSLAIPDHYFLQGRWLGDHLAEYSSRDSWIEIGLRNGFVTPYFRREGSSLSELLAFMEGSDRRGFSAEAQRIAERIDRTPFTASHWSSVDNSALFGAALTRYLNAEQAPMLETGLDPDDFVGFWNRSREWIGQELAITSERSSTLLGSEGILLSQLIQVSGERLLGDDLGRIESVSELLLRVKSQVGATAERDLRVYYTCACELYNRSLANTILTAGNSPRWEPFVAAMDLWRNNLLSGEADAGGVVGHPDELIDVSIRLPRPAHLRLVSGDVLLTIRRSPACERYFEALSHWRRAPTDQILRDELVNSLRRYSGEITKHVGKEVGVLGFRPHFISKVSDVSEIVEKVPGVVQGFLAVGATAGAAAAGTSSPLIPAGLFSLFCLQVAAKYVSPSESAKVLISPRLGARMRADITISHR
ncbi:hypothetical protein ABT255_49710 [Streptomyces mirabilis]|uniref:hypothetical protein n=1 Tax=Streptomyces TaxID=1883 RepID=UPI001161E3B7|nr:MULTISPECIES: hypothetical protein [Streptomyces]MCX4615693.1 hypothetical protein [Streptomyces mirabilis]MCX5355486.1 hypothetical protein [Streptomyces mirabilis]QDN93172.1 hypothetical protein FNV61_54280 [Streptomyces sp. RLB3-6]